MANHFRLEDHRDEAGGAYRLLTPDEAAAVAARYPTGADNPFVAESADGRYITAAGMDWRLTQRADDDEADPDLWG